MPPGGFRQAIARGITNSGRTVRLPVHAGELLNRVVNARDHFEAQHGRRATIIELARDVQVSPDRVTEVLRHLLAPVSLSEPLLHGGHAELGDLIEDHGAVPPFEAAAAALLCGDVAKMLTGLDGREREVIELRFGIGGREPCTLEEVGTHFGLTRERIRQIEARAMEKLRHPTAGLTPGADRRTESSRLPPRVECGDSNIELPITPDRVTAPAVARAAGDHEIWAISG